MPIFRFVKWTVQYKQSIFEFREVNILQTFKIDLTRSWGGGEGGGGKKLSYPGGGGLRSTPLGKIE